MIRDRAQHTLFPLPEKNEKGLIYKDNFILKETEYALIKKIQTLPFARSKLGGYEAKRRYCHFGWGYDHQKRSFIPGPPLPSFLTPLISKIAKWRHIPKERIVEALVLEYTPGSRIGWHIDQEHFEHIIGISLGGWSVMRFRPHRKKERGEVLKISLEPRSAYVLEKHMRWQWQHSIAPVSSRRYSITFRTLPK